eukprot:TRINITY_DN856_c0_g1_i1.p1 TRINITY_DN856_c0_g1~~TRINITY_DN856_c0_g1_i1.p1  ORF type:complete len:258 (-),score=53.10 TRINITY_DN856_c0_g1_i1:238-966(-)
MADDAKTIARMREILGPDAEGVDDHTLWRFFHFRQLTAEKGAAAFLAQKEWAAKYMPLGYIPDKEVEGEFHQKRAFLQVNGTLRPVVILICRNHDSIHRDIPTFTRYAVYVMQRAIASLPPGETQFDIILDMKGAAYKNMDVRGIISVFGVLQTNFTGFMRHLYLIHVPTIFWGVWRVISPVLLKPTKERIVFVLDKNLVAALQNDAGIDKRLLPPEYGGTAETLVEVEDVDLPNWPPIKSA